MGHPTIYPTGATLYDPSRACSGQVLGSWCSSVINNQFEKLAA